MCAEAKQYQVTRMQQCILSSVTRYASVTHTMWTRTATTSRHEDQKIGNNRRRLKRSIQQQLRDLAATEALHGDQLPYSVDEVVHQVEAWLDMKSQDGLLPELVLPWSGAVSTTSKLVRDQQLYLRGQEEQAILIRECQDMIVYYQQHVECTQSQKAAVCASLEVLNLGGEDAAAEADRVLACLCKSNNNGPLAQQATVMASTTLRPVVARACAIQRGVACLVDLRLGWLEQRLADAQAAAAVMCQGSATCDDDDDEDSDGCSVDSAGQPYEDPVVGDEVNIVDSGASSGAESD